MTTNADTSETMLAPDDAFAVLGNETRMEILQTLGEADEPLPFSELRGRVGMRDSGQFNYHLGKLDGHFIKDTDGGYALGQKGSRVIEAVLSGAVTDTPVLDRTPVDMSCYCCGATP
ncbi:MAG: helix-turn-helix domain-containing protein, partial [Halolamina sp.]